MEAFSVMQMLLCCPSAGLLYLSQVLFNSGLEEELFKGPLRPQEWADLLALYILQFLVTIS